MRLLDTNGKPLTKKKAALAVFFVSIDGENWQPLKPKMVPVEMKDNPDVMACLFDGEILEDSDHVYYRVELLN